jgi:hypothetical protein
MKRSTAPEQWLAGEDTRKAKEYLPKEDAIP